MVATSSNGWRASRRPQPGDVLKILAIADLHGKHALYRRLPDLARRHEADALVLAGDLLGAPAGYPTIEDSQRVDAAAIVGILASFALPVLYILGNDDMVPLENAPDHLIHLHDRTIEIGGYGFVGYQYTLPFMGGVNERPEEVIAADLDALGPRMNDRTVLVTHGPAYGSLDQGFFGEAVGSPSLAAVIARRNVRAHVHGHVHGRFGRSGRHFNVASGGKHLRAMVIELASLDPLVIDEAPPEADPYAGSTNL